MKIIFCLNGLHFAIIKLLLALDPSDPAVFGGRFQDLGG
jgi:hypothetical protein